MVGPPSGECVLVMKVWTAGAMLAATTYALNFLQNHSVRDTHVKILVVPNGNTPNTSSDVREIFYHHA